MTDIPSTDSRIGSSITLYFAVQKEIYEYFGYVEDWRVIPLSDCRKFYWHLEGDGPGTVYYANTPEDVATGEGYSDTIYTQRLLPKWVYRGPEFTMVFCDPGVDGNKFLRVFDNAKEVAFATPRSEEIPPCSPS